MILPKDFKIEIGETPLGPVVAVTHVPTGNRRVVDPVGSESVGSVRDRLIRELIHELYDEDDIEVSHVLTDRGCVLMVKHKPSGKIRWSLPARNRSSRESEQALLDQILEELAEERGRVE